MAGQPASTQPTIDSYAFDRIVVDGREYTSDLIVLPTGVVPNWWRRRGHDLCADDLRVVLDAVPRCVVIGQGTHGLMQVSEEALTCLRDADIEVVCLPTAQAVDAYNERAARGDAVAAALHLTC
jgi:hypothetical protein